MVTKIDALEALYGVDIRDEDVEDLAAQAERELKEYLFKVAAPRIKKLASEFAMLAVEYNRTVKSYPTAVDQRYYPATSRINAVVADLHLAHFKSKRADVKAKFHKLSDECNLQLDLLTAICGSECSQAARKELCILGGIKQSEKPEEKKSLNVHGASCQ